MATDDERRRVAAELRGMHDYETPIPIIRTCLGLRPGMLMDNETRRRMSDRLADLIEPSDTSPSCRDAVACDRDMLYVTYSRSTCGPDGMAYMVKVRHRTKGWERDFYAVDHEALLALADEMDRRQHDAATAATDGVVDAWCLREYARRIREACGEVVG